MRVAAEPSVVFPAPEPGQILLLMGGYRIVLAREEAHILVERLSELVADRVDRIPAQTGLAATSSRSVAPGGSPDGSAIAAKVAEQVISWARIAETVLPKK